MANNNSGGEVRAPAAAAVAAAVAVSRIRRKPAGSGAKAGPCNHCGEDRALRDAADCAGVGVLFARRPMPAT
jgi:hypothetical protein